MHNWWMEDRFIWRKIQRIFNGDGQKEGNRDEGRR